MKISVALTLAFAFSYSANAHHCNEFTSNVSTQAPYGWFGRKRRVANPSKQQVIKQEEDLIHRHDMHSFTGAEGIDHQSDKDGGDYEVQRPRSHRKMLKTMSDNLLRRHDMHSYTSLEGLDHTDSSSKSVDEQKYANVPTAVQNSRRRRIDRFRSLHATSTIKPVKKVQQKYKEEEEYSAVGPMYDLQYPLYPYLL